MRVTVNCRQEYGDCGLLMRHGDPVQDDTGNVRILIRPCRRLLMAVADYDEAAESGCDDHSDQQANRA